MDNPYKPHGYSTVSPYLVVDGAQRVIDFLIATFEAEQLRRYDQPDGSIMHVEVRIGDTVVMLGDSGEEHPASPVTLHVYVPDVDATYARALSAGGSALEAPREREGDPDRRGSVLDTAGNTWAIATQLRAEEEKAA